MPDEEFPKFEELKKKSAFMKQAIRQGDTSYFDALNDRLKKSPDELSGTSTWDVLFAHMQESATLGDVFFDTGRQNDPRNQGPQTYEVKLDPMWQSIPDNQKGLFLDAATPTDLRKWLVSYRMEQRAQTIMAESTFMQNLMGGMGASFTDPIDLALMALPGGLITGKILGAANKARLMSKVIRSPITRGITENAVGAGVRELILQKRQFERTDEEVFWNFMSEAMLGGVFGAGSSALRGTTRKMMKSEITRMGNLHEATIKAMEEGLEEIEARGLDVEDTEARVAVMTEVLTRRGNEIRINDKGIKAAMGKALGRLSRWAGTPMTTGALSDFDAFRLFTNVLSDNRIGRVDVPDELIQSSLDTVQYRYMAQRYQATGEAREIYAKLGPGGIKTKDEFMRLVGQAQSYDGAVTASTVGNEAFSKLNQQDVAAVTKAAKILAAEDKKLERLGKSIGALSPNANVGETALTHFTRVWDNDKVVGKRNDARLLVRGFLEEEAQKTADKSTTRRKAKYDAGADEAEVDLELPEGEAKAGSPEGRVEGDIPAKNAVEIRHLSSRVRNLFDSRDPLLSSRQAPGVLAASKAKSEISTQEALDLLGELQGMRGRLAGQGDRSVSQQNMLDELTDAVRNLEEVLTRPDPLEEATAVPVAPKKRSPFKKTKPKKVSQERVDKIVDNMASRNSGLFDDSGNTMGVKSGKGRNFNIPNDYEISVTGPDGAPRTLRTQDFTQHNAELISEHHTFTTLPRLIMGERFKTEGMSRARVADEMLADSIDELDKAWEADDEIEVDRQIMLSQEREMKIAMAEIEDVLEVHGRQELISDFRRASAGMHRARRRVHALTVERRNALSDLEPGEALDAEMARIDEALKVAEKTQRKARKGMKPATDVVKELGGARGSLPGAWDVGNEKWRFDGDAVDKKTAKARKRATAARTGMFERAWQGKRVIVSAIKQLDEAVGNAKSAKEVGRITRKFARDLKAMQTGMRRFHHSSAPMQGAGRIAEVGEWLKDIAYTVNLGGVTLASIPDAGTSILWNGLGNWFGSLSRIMPAAIRLMKKVPPDDLKKLFHGGEVVNTITRQDKALSMDESRLRPGNNTNVANQVRQKVRKSTTAAFALSRWNSTMKQWSASQIQPRMIEAVFKGWDKLDADEISWLENMGVNQPMFNRWQKQLLQYRERAPMQGTTTHYEWANVGEWDDKGASAAWTDMIITNANASVMTVSSMSLPPAFDSQLGGLLLMFKSFGVEAINRLLVAGLTRRDASQVTGYLSMIMIGHVGDVIRKTLAGQEVDYSKPKQLFVDAVDRSGVLGSFMDVDNILNRVFGFGTSSFTESSGATRYSAKSKLDAALGPALGLSSNLLEILGFTTKFIGEDKFTQGNLNTLRRTLPWQNLFYTRTLLDKAQAALAQGLPESNR